MKKSNKGAHVLFNSGASVFLCYCLYRRPYAQLHWCSYNNNMALQHAHAHNSGAYKHYHIFDTR